MIPVTKPFLPPLQEYQSYVEDIWKRNWLTNDGPLVNALEKNLCEKLKVNQLLFVTNGTIAIQLAIRALNLKGKIITTPFSYVATTSSIIWENCEPLFVDIDPENCNLDPTKIEAAITSDTTAILATHVYGIPCAVEQIESIAKKFGLKVIYDGAHAFGVQYKGQSVFNWGDISTCSFHATKLFHTIEGGAVFTNDPEYLKRMKYHRNFGHDGFDKFAMLGINGKNSEFHAAMGLVNLKYADQILEKRKTLCTAYDQRLSGLKISRPVVPADCTYNYAYYPVVFESEEILLKVMKTMNEQDIYPRRYFYPTLDSLSYLKSTQHCPIATSIASRILCLPLFDALELSEIDQVCSVIKKEIN
jgi:dTDP-4-amino-4,6-dideoxygalactose transaminase